MGGCAQLIARMADDRALLREWLLSLSRSSGMTLSAIAREADVSTTTLTRFVNASDYKFDLARRTIRKIEDRFGSRAPIAPSTHDADVDEFDDKPDGAAKSKHAQEVVMVTDHALDLHGLRRGDLCQLDPAAEASPGDLVQAEIHNSLHKRERIVRIFSPPYLLAHSTSLDLNKPLLIEPGRVRILGVLVKLSRHLRTNE